MSFRVVIDSCGELTDEMKKSGNFVSAPLTLQVDEYIVQDDEEHFNQAEFLKKVAECPNCPKSSALRMDVWILIYFLYFTFLLFTAESLP